MLFISYIKLNTDGNDGALFKGNMNDHKLPVLNDIRN